MKDKKSSPEARMIPREESLCHSRTILQFSIKNKIENDNFLLLVTDALNPTISHYWSINEKEIILCGDNTFRTFGKVPERLWSSLHYIYTQVSHAVHLCGTDVAQYRPNLTACCTLDYVLFTSEIVYRFPVKLTLLFFYFE